MKQFHDHSHYIYSNEMDTEEMVMRSVESLCIDDNAPNSNTILVDDHTFNVFYKGTMEQNSISSQTIDKSKLSQNNDKMMNIPTGLCPASKTSSFKTRESPGNKINKKISASGKTGRKRMQSPPPVDCSTEDFEISALRKSEAQKQSLREMREIKILAYKKQVQQESRTQRLQNRRRVRSSSFGANNDQKPENVKNNNSRVRIRSVSFALETNRDEDLGTFHNERCL